MSEQEDQDKHIKEYTNDVYAATPSSGSGGGEEEEEQNEKGNGDQGQQMEVAYNYLQTPKEESSKNVSEWVSQASTFTAENSMENDEITGVKMESMEQDDGTRLADEFEASENKNDASEVNLQESGEKLHLQSTFKIFVSNLPPGLLNSELMELFQNHGEVAECEIFAKNYAFVHMMSEDAGMKAMENLNGLDLRGCKINVKRSVQSSHPVKKNPSSIKEPEPEVEMNLEVGTFKIYIGNLHSEVTKEYVSKLLEPFGRIVEIEIFRSTSAFVHMETEEGGKKAIEELHGKTLPESEDENALTVSESKNIEGPTIAAIKLIVKNLDVSVSPDELRNLFTPYGLVLKVLLLPKIHKSSGCRTAIVHLEQFGNIRSAIKDLTGKEVGNSAILVEATFDKPKQENYKPSSIISRPPQRPVLNQRDRSEWTPVVSSAPQYVQHSDWNSKMRLIPMPSEAELHKFPGRGRGRRLARPPRGPPQLPFMGQHQFPAQPPWRRQNNYNNEGYDNYNNEGFDRYNDGGYGNYSNEGYGDYNSEGFGNFNNEGYGNCNNRYNETFSDGFGGGYSNTNFEEAEEFNVSEFEEYDWSQQTDGNDYAPPPMKIPRNQSRNNSRNFAGNPGHQNGRPNGRGKQNNFNNRNANVNPNNMGRKGQFPQLPAPEQFPKVPKSLMSMQLSKPEDHDWSSDLPISGFSAFSSDQDFASDEPINSTLNAVPFDYSQMKKKKNFQNNSNNWQKNPNSSKAPQQATFQGKGNQFVGKGRKGKSARRPGLGSSQQQKKFSHQAGNDEEQDSSAKPGEWEPVNYSSTGEESATASSSAYAPYYFQQNWSFSKGKQNNKKPTAKQMKEAEEEQKRQYADYLKQKPWLYQAIPGTVKKVQQ